MKVAALGRTQSLYDAIQAVRARGHEIVLIGTCPAAPEYRVTERDFEALAAQLGCPFFCDTAINKPEYRAMARESGAEVAISVNWMTLIGADMLGTFPHGVVNAHMGDLPRYRGNATPNWAILNGEPQVVLTLHQMATDLDAGAILLQQAYPLTSTTYIGNVYQFINETLPTLFADLIDGLENGSITPRPQPDDPALSLRCFPRLPVDSQIDWTNPADELARLVRASAEPFAGAYTFWNGEKVIVWRAYPDRLPYPYLGAPGQAAERRTQSGEVVILTGDGVLVLQEVETATEGRKPAAQIIRSLRARLGTSVETELALLRQQVQDLTQQVAQLQARLKG
jgi:methionyl-tRNA formyltransferase